MNSSEWHTITVAEVNRLHDAIESVVEHRSDYGTVRPDWEQVISEIEESEDGLDLGDSMTSPVVKEILKVARKFYREMKIANE